MNWRVVVIGLGWVAEAVHLPYLCASPEVDVVAAFDMAVERRELMQRRFGVPTVGSLEAALAQPADVVAVLTPPASHSTLVRAALGRGRHVIVEKPLATTATEARELVACAQEVGRALFCCMTNRYRGDVNRLAREVAQGRVGTPRYVAASWLRREGVPATLGGIEQGVLWDLGSHMVDTVLWITRAREPRVRFASCLRMAADNSEQRAAWQTRGNRSAPEYQGPDAAFLELELTDLQALSRIEVSWSSQVPSDLTRVLVVGTKGAIRLRTVFGWSPWRDTVPEPAVAVAEAGAWAPILTPQDRTHHEYRAQLTRFFEACTEGTSLQEELALSARTTDVLDEAAHFAGTASLPAVA